MKTSISTLDITVRAKLKDSEIDFDIDLMDTDSLDDIKQKAYDDYYTDEGGIDEIGLKVIEWGEVHKNYQDLITVFEYLEAVREHENLEMVNAAIECGVSLDDIGEAFQGEYRSDEDFAREMAEQLGSLEKDPAWPYTCIDWEQAAKELMYDYSEDSGYYFRNL